MAPLSRFGVIGDIHAEHLRLSRALVHLRSAGVDQILSVGDIVDGQGDVDRCCELLREARAVVVRGNHDRWFTRGTKLGLPHVTAREAVSEETRAFIDALPATARLETAAGPLMLCHGVGEEDMTFLREHHAGYAIDVMDELQALLRAGWRFMIGGHTHERMVRQIGSLTIINAGTLRRDDDPGFGLVDLGERRVEWFDVDEDGVRAARFLDLPRD